MSTTRPKLIKVTPPLVEDSTERDLPLVKSLVEVLDKEKNIDFAYNSICDFS